MGVAVMKFGGTSVATAEKILAAARRAIAARAEGHDVAVVVSARGHTTDELVGLALEIAPHPPARELDMLMATGEQQSIALLAMAIHALGHEAVSLTGGQMGIETDNVHGRARIRAIDPQRVRRAFAEGRIAIVAGFQGVDAEHNITTLGRGGSDTTAVAIAAALGAERCDIFTDVDGIYTTDPRQEPRARRLERISYDEMLELASVGAGVMHSRAIEFAKKFGVVVQVRHAGKDGPGTAIVPEDPVMRHVLVRGAALAMPEARVTLRGVADRPGAVRRLFEFLSDAQVAADMIVQNIGRGGVADISFTVASDDLAKTLPRAEQAAADLGGRVDFADGMAKVSIVGLGMAVHSGVADRMFKALAAAGINIHMISTSEIKVSCLVDGARATDALRAAHAEFALHERLPEAPAAGPRRPHENAADAARLLAIARSLPTMEDILVSAVDLDLDQARVTCFGVPDRPGVSAALFAAVAKAEVPIDLILQSVGADGTTHVSFTTCRRADLPAAAAAARGALDALGGGELVTDAAMAKLSVRGVGMRSHGGVARKVFEALAAADVNVQLIGTSELHIAVVVAESQGLVARDALRRAFGLDAA